MSTSIYNYKRMVRRLHGDETLKAIPKFKRDSIVLLSLRHGKICFLELFYVTSRTPILIINRCSQTFMMMLLSLISSFIEDLKGDGLPLMVVQIVFTSSGHEMPHSFTSKDGISMHLIFSQNFMIGVKEMVAICFFRI